METLTVVLVLLAALAVISAVCAYARPKETKAFFEARVDFLMRLWTFWGPRITDRTFIAAIVANGVALNVIDPAKANVLVLAAWVGANLLFPIWDNHPAGEKVLKPREGDDLVLTPDAARGH